MILKKYKISYRGSRIKIEVEASDRLSAFFQFLIRMGEFTTEEAAKKLLKSGYVVFHRK